MRQLAIVAALGILAAAALSEVVLLAPPASVNGTATNSVAAPAGMQGWAEVDAAASGHAVYSLLTYDGTGATLRAVSPLAPPVTNAAGAAQVRFPAAAVNRSLFVVTSTTNAVTSSALLRYVPTYPTR